MQNLTVNAVKLRGPEGYQVALKHDSGAQVHLCGLTAEQVKPFVMSEEFRASGELIPSRASFAVASVTDQAVKPVAKKPAKRKAK